MRSIRVSSSIVVILCLVFMVGTAEARFLSVDPKGGQVGSSQSWNRYTYVQNNPVNLVDPTGMREAEIYNETHDVEPGYVVALQDPESGDNVHVVVVAGFEQSEGGGLPQATIVENSPQDPVPGSIVGHLDGAPHQPVPVNSNSPDLLYNSSNVDVGNITQNVTLVSPSADRGPLAGVTRPFTSGEVQSTVNAVGAVQYDNTGMGERSSRTDCAGYVNQLVDRLGGTASSRTWSIFRFGQTKDITHW